MPLQVLPPTAESLAAIVCQRRAERSRSAGSPGGAAGPGRPAGGRSVGDRRHCGALPIQLFSRTATCSTPPPRPPPRTDQLALLAAAKSTNKALASTAAAERWPSSPTTSPAAGSSNPAALLDELKQAPAGSRVGRSSPAWPAAGRATSKPPLSPELETTLGELFDKLPPAGKSQLVTLATRWGSQGLGEHIAKLAAGFLADASNDELGRRSPHRRGRRSTSSSPQHDAEAGEAARADHAAHLARLARGLVEALGQSESPDVGAALADRLPS